MEFVKKHWSQAEKSLERLQSIKKEISHRTGLKNDLALIYRALEMFFGPQSWWPAETPFEVMIGAILTQNTNWKNVERAIDNLKQAGLMSPESIAECSHDKLAELIRPAGYFNVKADRLISFIGWFVKEYGGELERMFKEPPAKLRKKLLSVRGIGPETADSILLYAGGIPSFVVDAYTRRIFSRHGFCASNAGYDELKELFEYSLPRDPQRFNEYHALLVALGKDYCRPRPLCELCPVREVMLSLGRPVSLE